MGQTDLIVESVKQLTTDCTARGSNPGGGEIFRTRTDRPWDSPSLLYDGYRVISGGVKRTGRGVDLPRYLAPRLKK